MTVQNHFPLILLYTDNTKSINGATRFQKLVFLAQQEQPLPEIYEFYPDRFGPYSMELRQDLQAMLDAGYIHREILTNEYGRSKIVYGLTDKGVRLVQTLAPNDRYTVLFDIAERIKRQYNYEPITDLLRYVYGRYDDYVTASEIDIETLFDPDARTEFEVAPRARTEPSTLADQLTPTPYTLWQLPDRETNAYFYYFTDAAYTAEDSKYKRLDDQLTLLGRNRTGVEVVMVDRDQIRRELWNAVMTGLEINSYPALVVAEQELGFKELDLDTDEFTPNDVDYAILQSGIIQDELLDNVDDLTEFLNNLYDAAQENNVGERMRHERVMQWLSITKEQLDTYLRLVP